MKKIKEIALQDSPKSLQPSGTFKGRDVYDDNPFLTGFCLQVRNGTTIVAGDISVTDKESEEISCGVIGMIKQIDTENFVKLYTKHAGSIFDLSSAAQKTLIAVFCAVQDQAINKAEIFLSYEKALKYYEAINYDKTPKINTFVKGIKDLCNAGFIAQHTNGQGWWWTNPNMIFNGDRIRFMTEYRLKRKEELTEF